VRIVTYRSVCLLIVLASVFWPHVRLPLDRGVRACRCARVRAGSDRAGEMLSDNYLSAGTITAD
jgi:hypothetical protein